VASNIIGCQALISGAFFVPAALAGALSSSGRMDEDAAGAVSQMVSPPAMQLICTPLHLMAGPAHSSLDGSLIVYRCTRTRSPHPPWSGHLLPFQLNLTVAHCVLVFSYLMALNLVNVPSAPMSARLAALAAKVGPSRCCSCSPRHRLP